MMARCTSVYSLRPARPGSPHTEEAQQEGLAKVGPGKPQRLAEITDRIPTREARSTKLERHRGRAKRIRDYTRLHRSVLSLLLLKVWASSTASFFLRRPKLCCRQFRDCGVQASSPTETKEISLFLLGCPTIHQQLFRPRLTSKE